tara:strand:- start:7684 stop:8148 length:465 start_codon:yes stop_codon:yes gene_type:complete
MQQIYNMYFPDFNPHSKVWIYNSDRRLKLSEQKIINNELKKFVNSWQAHNLNLKAEAILEHNYFIILVVDESNVKASGCSIDTSVKLIKSIGERFSVNFFNRLNLVIEKQGEYNLVHISDIKKYPQWNVFNPMITDLSSLREKWKMRVIDSPFF